MEIWIVYMSHLHKYTLYWNTIKDTYKTQIIIDEGILTLMSIPAIVKTLLEDCS